MLVSIPQPGEADRSTMGSTNTPVSAEVDEDCEADTAGEFNQQLAVTGHDDFRQPTRGVATSASVTGHGFWPVRVFNSVTTGRSFVDDVARGSAPHRPW